MLLVIMLRFFNWSNWDCIFLGPIVYLKWMTKEPFFIPSASDINKVYDVNLGDKGNFPSCDCMDWIRSHMPCKHMLAILETEGGCDWERMSERYRQLPFISLDSTIVCDPVVLVDQDIKAADQKVFSKTRFPQQTSSNRWQRCCEAAVWMQMLLKVEDPSFKHLHDHRSRSFAKPSRHA